jgi:anti-sigma B factor antagonist
MMTQTLELLVTHPADGVTVVSFSEYALAEASREATREKLYALVEATGQGELRLDFAQIGYLDSSALAVLVTLHRRMTQSEGNLVLEKLAPYLVELFKLTRLDTVLNIQPAEVAP